MSVSYSKIEGIGEILDRIHERRISYTIVKSNKGFMLKDGFIKWSVSFSPKIRCPCSETKYYGFYCYHLLWLFSYEWKFSDELIAYLTVPQIQEKFSQLAQSKQYGQMRNVLEKELAKFMREEDCFVCLESLGAKQFKRQLFECPRCHKFVHLQCMNQWIATKKSQVRKDPNYDPKKEASIERGCIYCQNKVPTQQLPGDRYFL